MAVREIMARLEEKDWRIFFDALGSGIVISDSQAAWTD